MDTRSRLVSTALLVLVALGGAGLAVAADRPHGSGHRPELTWAADRAAQPWIAAARERLSTVEEHVGGVSASARGVLARLQALDVAGVRESLAGGAEAAAATGDATAQLKELLAESESAIERWRLGVAPAEELERIDAASDAATEVPGLWARVDDRATAVVVLLELLTRHDEHILLATAAARQARFDDAIAELAMAVPLLREAEKIRDDLQPVADTEAMTDLLGRYSTYDAALLALYEFLAEGGQQSGAEFLALEGAVEEAQAALPTDNGALSVLVAEAASAELAEALVEIEEARGDILAALADEAEQ